MSPVFHAERQWRGVADLIRSPHDHRTIHAELHEPDCSIDNLLLMNKNEPAPAFEAIQHSAPQGRGRSKWKIVLSLFLGLVSVFLMFFLGETWGERAMFPGLAAYFLISQYFLSRGNPQAICKDWPYILALNLPLLASDITCLIVEPNTNTGAKLSALCMGILAVACSYAGAGVAARTARH